MLSPSQATIPVLVQPDGSLCGEAGEAQKLAGELAKRYPRSVPVNGLSLPVVRAAIELQRRRPEQAIEFLKAAAPYEGGSSAFWPNYLRGQAYLRLGKGAEAAAEFRKILEHRGWDPISPFYPLAHLGLARSAALTGDAAESRKVYEDFFALWKDADTDLPVLQEARREYEKLKQYEN
jgi:predicted Zn-dependent protease